MAEYIVAHAGSLLIHGTIKKAEGAVNQHAQVTHAARGEIKEMMILRIELVKMYRPKPPEGVEAGEWEDPDAPNIA